MRFLVVCLITGGFFFHKLFAPHYEIEVQQIIRGALLSCLQLENHIEQPNGAYSILEELHSDIEKDNINVLLDSQKYAKVKKHLIHIRNTMAKDPDFQEALKKSYFTQLPENWELVRIKACHLVGYWAQVKIKNFTKQKNGQEDLVAWLHKNRKIVEKDSPKMKAAFLGQFIGSNIIVKATRQQ